MPKALVRMNCVSVQIRILILFLEVIYYLPPITVIRVNNVIVVHTVSLLKQTSVFVSFTKTM